MGTVYAILAGFALDLLLGDPAWLPHPVVWMGKAIAKGEAALRRALPATPGGEQAGGVILAALLPLASFAAGWGVLALCRMLHPLAGFAAESWMCYQVLATRELRRQSMLVYAALKNDTVQAARLAVGRIVGRDTGALDETGIAKAAVETVAENAGDGVVAPLVFLALGGAPLGLAYKAVNTMDSMIGYRNEKYLFFGRAAARLDDVANWLPARLCALCMVAAAPLAGLSAGGAFRIWRRDRRNHASPNSAQSEAAAAGALGIQLAGGAVYFGRRVEKLTIGDALRPCVAEDIRRAGRLMLCGGLLALGLCCGARAVFVVLLGV